MSARWTAGYWRALHRQFSQVRPFAPNAPAVRFVSAKERPPAECSDVSRHSHFIPALIVKILSKSSRHLDKLGTLCSHSWPRNFSIRPHLRTTPRDPFRGVGDQVFG